MHVNAISLSGVYPRRSSPDVCQGEHAAGTCDGSFKERIRVIVSDHNHGQGVDRVVGQGAVQTPLDACRLEITRLHHAAGGKVQKKRITKGGGNTPKIGKQAKSRQKRNRHKDFFNLAGGREASGNKNSVQLSSVELRSEENGKRPLPSRERRCCNRPYRPTPAPSTRTQPSPAPAYRPQPGPRR